MSDEKLEAHEISSDTAYDGLREAIAGGTGDNGHALCLIALTLHEGLGAIHERLDSIEDYAKTIARAHEDLEATVRSHERGGEA
jgi:hypothetical protein